MSPSFVIRPSTTHTSSLAFKVLSFAAPLGLQHLPALLLVSNSSMFAILMAFSRIPSNDSWVVTATVVSSLFVLFQQCFRRNSSSGIRCCRTSEFVSLLRHPFVPCFRHSSDVLCFRTSGRLSRSCHRRLPSIFCVGVSATARLPSICELPLLAAAVAAFMTRLFLGSESSGIGTSFNSSGLAVLPIPPFSDVSLYFFCECLVTTPLSSIQTL